MFSQNIYPGSSDKYVGMDGRGREGDTWLFFVLIPDLFRSVWFRNRIRLDPYHSAGSGSTSGNVDPDPGSTK